MFPNKTVQSVFKYQIIKETFCIHTSTKTLDICRGFFYTKGGVVNWKWIWRLNDSNPDAHLRLLLYDLANHYWLLRAKAQGERGAYVSCLSD